VTRNFRIRLIAVCLAVASAFAQSSLHSLTILHTNDLHAHLQPDSDGVGGFAYLAAELRHQREGCRGCLYLNAGDLVQGTPVSTIYHGIPVYQISNLLGIDVSTPGNHEFDYGWKNVELFEKTAHYPLVSDNVADAQGRLLTHRGYAIRKVDGVRIAVIGLMLGDLVGNLSTEEQVGPWRVTPVVEAVRKTVAELRGKADLIVALGHIHSGEAEQIVHEIPEVSVVVIGHEHTGYKELHRFGNQYIVEAKSYGAELGRLDFQFDSAKHQVVSAEWKTIPIDSHKISPAPDVQKLVDSWESKVSKIVDVPIGESKRRLAGADLRRLIETAMAEESGADIAWINSGNVRGFLPQGQILARHVWDILPFDNFVVMGTFRGSEIPATVKREFPNLDPDKTYKLATTDFTAANQASQGQFGVSGLKFPVQGQLQRDAMIEWVKKKKVLE
jgi:2',3'-cyclic-nucleotide 2'-phosphodiesterase (5'-nucleotidase family)